MNDTLRMLIHYVAAFAVGGALCALAQLLVVKTKLTPARILVVFLLAGIFLEGIGVFRFMQDFAGGGVTVPILGFGAVLARGSIEYAKSHGVAGAFAGGLIKTAYGIGVAIIASYAVTLIFSPKTKK